MATVKKPIVLYGGLMKQLQPGDVTPGQHDVSVAVENFQASETIINQSIAALSVASSECCASGRSIAIGAEEWASYAESIARDLDINGHASYALSVAREAESIGVWAEDRASQALSQAFVAVEVSDISEAHSVGKFGVELATDVSIASSECCLTNGLGVSEAKSMARDAAESGGAELGAFSESTYLSSIAYSNAIAGQSEAFVGEDLANSEAAAQARSIAILNEGELEAYSIADSTAQFVYSTAVENTFVDRSASIARNTSLARASKSAAYWYTDNFSTAVDVKSTAYSTAVQLDLDDLNASIGGGLNAYSIADNAKSNAYSEAVNNIFVDRTSSIAKNYSMAQWNEIRSSEATSIGLLAESYAQLAREAEVEYAISFGSDREGRFVYMTGLPNTVGLTKADDEARMPAFGIITFDNNTSVKVRKLADKIFDAKVDSDASPVVGGNLFVSPIESGKVTNIAPTIGVNQRVGSVNASTAEVFEMNMRIGEIVVL